MVRPIFFAVIFAMVAMYSDEIYAQTTEYIPPVYDYEMAPVQCKREHEEYVVQPDKNTGCTCRKTCLDLDGTDCVSLVSSWCQSECRCMSGYFRRLSDGKCVPKEECAPPRISAWEYWRTRGQ